MDGKRVIWEIPSVGWGRKCPGCKNIIIHKGVYSKYNATKSNKNSKLCFTCSNSPQSRINILNGDIWFENGRWYRRCPKCKKFIFREGKNSKAVASHAYRKGMACNSCSNSRSFSENTKEKMRIAVVKRVKKYGVHSRNFNPKACKFIDECGKRFGYSFQHALNGGECVIGGYFVDGYDEKQNAIFEYDESIHKTPSHKKKDIRRQKIIVDKVKPSIFIRYREYTNDFYDVVGDKKYE